MSNLLILKKSSNNGSENENSEKESENESEEEAPVRRGRGRARGRGRGGRIEEAKKEKEVKAKPPGYYIEDSQEYPDPTFSEAKGFKLEQVEGLYHPMSLVVSLFLLFDQNQL